MSLKSLLEISPGVTAVIGGGGKTSLLETLGKDLAAAGRSWGRRWRGIGWCARARRSPARGSSPPPLCP